MISAKFRPNPSTFRATFLDETYERRGTLQQSEGRFATLLLRPNRPEKGNHLASLGG